MNERFRIYVMQYITVKLLIADVVDSRSCILFLFAVTICHVSQFHFSVLHVLLTLPASKESHTCQ